MALRNARVTESATHQTRLSAYGGNGGMKAAAQISVGSTLL
jgi:hypothetical protein